MFFFKIELPFFKKIFWPKIFQYALKRAEQLLTFLEVAFLPSQPSGTKQTSAQYYYRICLQ